MVKLITSSDTRALARLLARDDETDPSLARRVAAIVADVRRGGDRALMAYARRFDRLDGAIELTADEIAEGAKQAPAKVRRALAVAARHIRRVAKTQVPRGSKLAVAPGVTVEQRVTPLERVGCYVPGGRYPLPSSLLMTAIPARVAGVREVIVACPRPEPAVLAAAMEAGVTRLFRMGGAHAIAALAYGTASVPRVDKIVGPGNAYVASAKALDRARLLDRFLRGPERNHRRLDERRARVDRRRSDGAGRTRSGRARDSADVEQEARDARPPDRSKNWRPPMGRRARRCAGAAASC